MSSQERLVNTAAIMEDYRAGATLQQIANTQGVSKPRIWQIVREHPEFPELKKEHREALLDRNAARRYRRCVHCGRGYDSTRKKQTFCSRKCFYDSLKKKNGGESQAS